MERSASNPQQRQRASLRIADLVIDLARQQATRAGSRLALTPRDLVLLAFLVRHAGKTVTRQRLAREVWKRSHTGRTNFVEVGMWRLRSKLDRPKSSRLIHAVRGVGYVCAVRK
jgi:two-component system copper resistance phosphate regulon response regulator CusR